MTQTNEAVMREWRGRLGKEGSGHEQCACSYIESGIGLFVCISEVGTIKQTAAVVVAACTAPIADLRDGISSLAIHHFLEP